jgi:hypothetical protein
MLSACQTTSSSAVFSDQCDAPCWRGIEPGETKFQDAVNLVKKFSDLDSEDIGISGPWNIFSDFIDFNLTNGENIRIYAIDDVVTLIDFYTPIGVTFQECIKVFGDPAYVVQYPKLGAGSSFFPSDARHIWFSAIDPKKGIVLTYDTENSFDLKESTTISNMSYFDIELFDNLYKNNLLINFDPLKEIPQSQLHAWKGYGDIRTLYP